MNRLSVSESSRSVGLGEKGDGLGDFVARGRDGGMGEAEGELEEAAGIAGGDDGGAGCGDVGELALEEFVGHFGLGDVVDAGAAAAPHGFGESAHFEAGDLARGFRGAGR